MAKTLPSRNRDASAEPSAAGSEAALSSDPGWEKSRDLDGQPATARLRVWLVAALLVCGLLSVATNFDVALAAWIAENRLPGDLYRLIELSEIFAHGLGVALILLTVLVLDPNSRRPLAWIAASAYGSGLMANAAKLLVARIRPKSYDLTQSALDSFQDWLPLLSGNHSTQSFPSAHTATAAGLAVGLIWVYPRGRWLFVLFAILATAQRLQSAAHYLSDTCCGAALGITVGSLIVSRGSRKARGR